jgi:REP element-mobilizing transposase RayT
MPRESPNPGRKQLPHLSPLEFGNQSTTIFLTVCAAKRRPLLANSETVDLLLDCWAQANHWLVGRWVVRPDHLHLFCAPATCPSTPLKSWARFWPNQTNRRWPNKNQTPIWQREFFDRQLRSGESYRQKWLYLWENPLKTGMVSNQQDWAYQGEMHLLSWHEPS